MTTKEEKAQGVVLRAFDYKDRQRIITLFTQEAGVISLIIKGISKKSYRTLALSTPLSEVEVLFTKGRSELFRFVDGTLLNEHLFLRQQYAFLQTAGVLAQAILQSQLPGKPSPALYQLFLAFLKQVPNFKNPLALLCSFRLKLLKHEGLIALSAQCAHCSANPAYFLLHGETVCAAHETPDALRFTPEEWEVLSLLENAPQFSTLHSISLPPRLPDLVNTCFLRAYC